MGRRAYLNRLALGRSPYEIPERSIDPPPNQPNSIQRRNSDAYVQEYDERGHPINPQSKTFGKELRRAKNDILSTMGIVVSEDGNRGKTEQQKIDVIVAENDYGLVMVTLDQISVFLGSWWTSSLIGRIQTFKSYAHIPLVNIINQERAALGTLGFYFAGVPAWAVSTCLSICRHHPLERLRATILHRFPNDDPWSKLVRGSLTIFHSAARGTLLILAMQSYMYSLLQSIHLVHPASLPGLGFFLPFGGLAAMQIPSLPILLSFHTVTAYLLNLLKTPSLFYVYVYLRPVVEIRLYRFIRRRLPKPTLTDELSIKVALDNDLIDWMVPTLGRRAEEETRRTNLSFMEDLLYEVNVLRRWVTVKLGFEPKQASPVVEPVADIGRRREWLESLPTSIEQLQNERQSHDTQQPVQLANSPLVGELPVNDTDATNLPISSLIVNHSADSPRLSGLLNEEPPTSPSNINNGDFLNMDPLRRARNIPAPTGIPPLAQREDNHVADDSRRHSRSNTLFSNSSSSMSSSPSSPRVRAQLIQDSDVIAMHLEVESRHTQHQDQTNARADREPSHQDINRGQHERRSISEFVDSLLVNQGPNLTTVVNSETADSDGLSNLTPGASPEVGVNVTTPTSLVLPESSRDEQPALVPTPAGPRSSPEHRFPNEIEEPSQDNPNNQPSETEPNLENDFDSEIFPRISDPNVRQTPVAAPSTAHRVTILSALPVDSLASHLASMLTSALFSPLESFYLRSLATSYLASIGASAALRSDIYGLGVWCGGKSRSDILAYMGKMVLMLGVQAAVNASVWGIISGTAIRIGRKWCGWGTL